MCDTAVATMRKTVRAIKNLVHPDKVEQDYNQSPASGQFTPDQIKALGNEAIKIMVDQGDCSADHIKTFPWSVRPWPRRTEVSTGVMGSDVISYITRVSVAKRDEDGNLVK